MEFQFPDVSFDGQINQVESYQQLRRTLNKIVAENHEKFKYKVKLVGKNYLYATCSIKSCSASLRYIKQDQVYKLKKIQRKHHHNRNLRKSRNEVIQKYIEKLPANLTPQKAKLMTCNDLRITQTQFYYFYRKVKHFKGTFSSLIDQLNQKDYDIRYQVQGQNEELPFYSLFISPQMKEYYSFHFQFIALDCTYGLIKQKYDQDTAFKVCSIVGMSASKKILPLGLAIMTRETKQAYYKVLTEFVKGMNKAPVLILSDQSLAIIGAVRQMIDEGLVQAHGLDKFHILKNVRKKLIHKPHLSFFKKLIDSPNEDLYELEMEQAINNLEEQEIGVLKSFLLSDYMYCFSKLPLCLFPSGSTDSYLEKVNDLIKRVIPVQQNYVTVVNRVLDLFETLIKKSNDFDIDETNADTYYDWKELKLTKYSVDKKIFQSIISEVSKMINIDIVHQDEKIVMMVDRKSNFEYKLYNKQGIFQCSCLASFKNGWPCNHQLKFLHRNSLPLEPYINKKWILQKFTIEKKLRAPRGKSTRTNRQK